MEKNELIRLATAYVENSAKNRVAAAVAIRPELAGMRIYEAPLYGFAAAADPWFSELKKPGVIGPHFRAPAEWLPGARTVVSFFLPFTKEVVDSNIPGHNPSAEWLHGRIEGQEMVAEFCVALAEALRKDGHAALIPDRTPDFFSSRAERAAADGSIIPAYTSCWSERHVAMVAGLGTFGLSAGLITARGMAGRLGSVITDADFPPDPRAYAKYNEYCIRCGACVKRCPAGAISLDKGKEHLVCDRQLDISRQRDRPRYGCGKCQVGVPCARQIPLKRI